MQSGYGVTGGITTLSPSAPTILFRHLFFNDQKYGGVIQLFSPHIRQILPIIRSFAMTLLHQIFRQAQSSICLNSPVLLNLTLFPDRLTALRIQITFLKVGTVCGTLSIALLPTFIPDRFTVLRIMQHFKRSELSAALPPPCFVLCTAVYTRPFHRVTHKCNISKGRNCQRRPAALLCASHRRLHPTVSVSNAHTLLF